MTTYVLGFLFSPDKKMVALIRKNKPDWQKGKLNGIGGRVETTDPTLRDAMIREFIEETGEPILHWQPFSELGNSEVRVHCYHSIGDAELKQTTDEFVAWYPIAKLPKLPVIGNLRWLIPLALDETTLHTEAIFA